jgi:hypothetical protein
MGIIMEAYIEETSQQFTRQIKENHDIPERYIVMKAMSEPEEIRIRIKY